MLGVDDRLLGLDDIQQEEPMSGERRCPTWLVWARILSWLAYYGVIAWVLWTILLEVIRGK